MCTVGEMKLVFYFPLQLFVGEISLSSILDEGYSQLHVSAALPPEKNPPGFHRIGGLESLRAGANALMNKLLDVLF